jgi:RNA polymerase sigma factor (sigma-70 family)
MKAVLQRSRVARDFAAHEEVFLARYRELCSWALQLTEHDRERAEDLVHDAYIQFTFAQPDLSAISNLNGYLYSLLRNLHLSQLRRSRQRQHRTISIVDYDSAEIGLRAADPRERIRLQDQLREVCRYACMRKETSKAGTVLILRFLHGYYPREIAQVMRGTREAVEERLRVARSEARQYIENPKSLRFLGHPKPENASIPHDGFAGAVDQFLNELRQMIFDSRRGECFTAEQINRLYQDEAKSGINHLTLAHLVSCPHCLEHVNRLLKLPSLAERFPTDVLGNDTDGRDGDGGGNDGGASGGGSEQRRQKCRKAARDVLEHRPSQLCVSVNGYLMAAQKVGSEFNEQTINIGIAEPIAFVEIFSEQEMRLLFLTVERDGLRQRRARIALSDDRILEAILNFDSSWPSLQVIYSDPSLAASPAPEMQPTLQPSLTADLSSDKPDEAGSVDVLMEHRTRWADKLTALAHGPGAFYKHHFVAEFFRRPSKKNERPATYQFVEAIKRWPLSLRFMRRPEMITVVLSLILIGALLLVRFHVPVVSASELLRRSTAAEQISSADVGTVVHRTVNIEARRLDGSVAPVRQRVEVWQSAARGLKLRRMYDEQNRLLASEWTRQDGISTIYRRDAERQPRSSTELDVAAILENGEVWRLDTSAATFSLLVKHSEIITIDERSNAYILNYQNPAAADAVQSASLTLIKANLRAIDEHLIVSHNGQASAYTLTETSFETKPVSSVAPEVFQPDSELSPAAGSGFEENTESSDSNNRKSPVEEIASPELEIEVTYLLNRIKADLGEQISLTRIPGGVLRVEALVENDLRKNQILQALTPLHNNPALKVEVRTVAEALKQQQARANAGTVREVEVVNDRAPADADLRAFFSARLVGDEAIQSEINRYSNRVMMHSRQALLHTSALKKLVERFSPADLSTLTPEAQGKWLEMISEHARSCRREIAALRQELRTVFGGANDASGEIVGEPNVSRSAARLLELSYMIDETVRSAFTISSEQKEAAAIKSGNFWRALGAAEKIADGIDHAYQK